jgi:hypothetical protein
MKEKSTFVMAGFLNSFQDHRRLFESANRNKLPDKVYGRISEVVSGFTFTETSKIFYLLFFHTESAEIVKKVSAYTASNYLLLRP